MIRLTLSIGNDSSYFIIQTAAEKKFCFGNNIEYKWNVYHGNGVRRAHHHRMPMYI